MISHRLHLGKINDGLASKFPHCAYDDTIPIYNFFKLNSLNKKSFKIMYDN